jgi:hypothetical protein
VSLSSSGVHCGGERDGADFLYQTFNHDLKSNKKFDRVEKKKSCNFHNFKYGLCNEKSKFGYPIKETGGIPVVQINSRVRWWRFPYLLREGTRVVPTHMS